MTQISTQRDAIEFLTGKWASKPNASYTEKDLENYRKGDLIDLAHMWEHEAKSRQITANKIEKIKAALITKDNFQCFTLIIEHQDKCTTNEAKSRAWFAGADAAKAAIHKFAKEHMQ